jgi:uncharacterized protein YxeA
MKIQKWQMKTLIIIAIAILVYIICLFLFNKKSTPEQLALLEKIADENEALRNKIRSGRFKLTHITSWNNIKCTDVKQMSYMFSDNRFIMKYSGFDHSGILNATQALQITNPTNTIGMMYSFDGTYSYWTTPTANTLIMGYRKDLEGWTSVHGYDPYRYGFQVNHLYLSDFIRNHRGEILVHEEKGLYVLRQGAYRIWVDPSKGCLIVRKSIKGIVGEGRTEMSVTKYENDLWYPSHIHSSQRYSLLGFTHSDITFSITIDSFEPNVKIPNNAFGLKELYHSNLQTVQNKTLSTPMTVPIQTMITPTPISSN